MKQYKLNLWLFLKIAIHFLERPKLLVFLISIIFFSHSAKALTIKQSEALIRTTKTSDGKVKIFFCEIDTCTPIGNRDGYSSQDLMYGIPKHLKSQVQILESNFRVSVAISTIIGGISFQLSKALLAFVTSWIVAYQMDQHQGFSRAIESLVRAQKYIPFFAKENFGFPNISGSEFPDFVKSLQVAFESYDQHIFCETNVQCRREIVKGMPNFSKMSDEMLMKHPVNYLKSVRVQYNNYMRSLKL